MPDLVTHLATGYVGAIPLRRRATLRLAFLTGVLLPDLLTRPFYILWPVTFEFVRPLHTPLTYAMACCLLTQSFAERQLRSAVLLGLLAGGALHFAADALQRQVLKPYLWLFPICRCETRWGLFSTEASVDALSWTLTICFLLCVVAKRIAGSKS